MESLQVKVLELTTNSKEAKSQVSSLLKNNLTFLDRQDFSYQEQKGVSENDFQKAIQKLKDEQEKVLACLEGLKPHQQVVVDCQINLKFL